MSHHPEVELVEWYPGMLFSETSHNESTREENFALIVLNVPLLHGATAPFPILWHHSIGTVAADGGANRLYSEIMEAGRLEYAELDVIIGDLDSLTEDAREYYEARITKIIHDSDQYSTDFGKAIKYLRNTCGNNTIVAYGGLGGRVDQGLSQLHHLYHFQQEPGYSQGQLYLVSEESVTFLLKSGSHRIRVRGYEDKRSEVFGKYVGIIPIREPSEITTKGLEWDVTDWHTEIGGQLSTSNHVLPETEVVEVHTTKDVLFTIALGIIP